MNVLLLKLELVLTVFLILNCQDCSSFDFQQWVVHYMKKTYFSHLPELSQDDIAEAALTPPELIARDGYPAETHTIETKDGYLLEVHRIPYGKKNTKSDDRIPVIFIPGNGCSSPMAVSGKSTSLGYVLAENGFDVWLGNLRGNKFSRKHRTISPDDANFWRYGADEHANFDVPAMIEYVLRETSSESVQLVTHSTGGLIALMMLARNPEYNKKVKGTVHLSPTVSFKYTSSLFRFLIENQSKAAAFFEFFGIYELPVTKPEVMFDICPTADPSFCEAVFYGLVGYNASFDGHKMPLYMLQCPAGFSTRFIDHLGQFGFSGKIRAYDFGSEPVNMEKYGQTEPPIYDLKEVTSQQAIFYGTNDPMGDPIDTAILIKNLNSSVFNYRVPDTTFTHIDFLYSDNGEKLVFLPLVDTLFKMWTNKY